MRTIVGALGLVALIASCYIFGTNFTSVESNNLAFNNGFEVASFVTFCLFLLATLASKIIMTFSFIEYGYNSFFETPMMALISIVLAVVSIILYIVSSSQSTIVYVQTEGINNNLGPAAAMFVLSTLGVDFMDCFTGGFDG